MQSSWIFTFSLNCIVPAHLFCFSLLLRFFSPMFLLCMPAATGSPQNTNSLMQNQHWLCLLKLFCSYNLVYPICQEKFPIFFLLRKEAYLFQDFLSQDWECMLNIHIFFSTGLKKWHSIFPSKLKNKCRKWDEHSSGKKPVPYTSSKRYGGVLTASNTL